ncbi:MAG: tetratricopeptide repeat protein, partial [Acidobacteriota bacterium]
FGQLHKDNPADIRGLVGVVETLAGQNRMEDAVAELRRAVAAEPKRRDLQIALANLLVRSEKYDEAVSIYKSIIAKEPKAADILFKLAETFRRKGDLNLAIENFRAASQAAPTDTNSLMQLALLLDGTGRRDQAKPVYEQILKLDNNHGVALNNLAYIKAEEGVDLDSALNMAQKARQNMPNSNDVTDTLGWIYIKKNMTEEAVHTFSDLVRKAPADPNYHYHYGKALLQKGDKQSARRELEASLKSNPSKDVASAVQDLLKSI